MKLPLPPVQAEVKTCEARAHPLFLRLHLAGFHIVHMCWSLLVWADVSLGMGHREKALSSILFLLLSSGVKTQRGENNTGE